jgi:hypothetical protein
VAGAVDAAGAEDAADAAGPVDAAGAEDAAGAAGAVDAAADSTRAEQRTGGGVAAPGAGLAPAAARVGSLAGGHRQRLPSGSSPVGVLGTDRRESDSHASAGAVGTTAGPAPTGSPAGGHRQRLPSGGSPVGVLGTDGRESDSHASAGAVGTTAGPAPEGDLAGGHCPTTPTPHLSMQLRLREGLDVRIAADRVKARCGGRAERTDPGRGGCGDADGACAP